MRHFLVILESGAQFRASQIWIGQNDPESVEEVCFVDLDGKEAGVPTSIVRAVAIVDPVPPRPTREKLGFRAEVVS